MNIIWKQPSGQIAITELTEDSLDPQDYAKILQQKNFIPSDWEAVAFNHTNFPVEQWVKLDAWIWDGKDIIVSVDLARNQAKEYLRFYRTPLLASQDLEFMQALEEGKPTTDIVAEKKRLRELPTTLDTVKDLAVLADVWNKYPI